MIYEHIKKLVRRREELSLLDCMLAAGVAKFTASSMCYPHGQLIHHHSCGLHHRSCSGAGMPNFFSIIESHYVFTVEVVRTRLRQKVSRDQRKYHSFFQTLLKVFQDEGMRGLYGGMSAHLLRVVPNAAIVFFTYEAVVSAIDRHGSPYRT